MQKPQEKSGLLKTDSQSFSKTFTNRVSERIADLLINAVGIALGLLIAALVGYTSFHQKIADLARFTPSWEPVDAKDTSLFDPNCEYRLHVVDAGGHCSSANNDNGVGVGSAKNTYFYPQQLGEDNLLFSYSSAVSYSVRPDTKGTVFCSALNYNKFTNEHFDGAQLEKRCAAPRK